jgi:hypothetical protein
VTPGSAATVAPLLLLILRLAFGAALLLFIAMLFHLLRRDSTGGSGT